MSLFEFQAKISGRTLGEIATEVLQESSIKRLVVAGGDTTGRIQKHLETKALQASKSIGMAALLYR